MTQQLDLLPYLPEPYEFARMRDQDQLVVDVIRWELGLSVRPIREPPGTAIRPTLRTHVPDGAKLEGPSWWDWTSQGLIRRFFSVYQQEIDTALLFPIEAAVGRLRKTSLQREDPLSLRITRHGAGDEIFYAVDVLDVEGR